MNVKNKGKLYLVGTPIGNLRDITLRAIETLKDVDVILAEDTRQTLKLLNHLEISKKLVAYHKFNETEKVEYVEKLLDEGNNLALVSDAGMPCISDPGEILVKHLVKMGYEVIVIPGVTAFVTALVKSTFSTYEFSFNGFLSQNKKERMRQIESIKNQTGTVIFYEAPHKLLATLKDFFSNLGNRNICIARELTKIYEEYKLFSLQEAIDYYSKNAVKGEIVILIEGKSKEEIKDEELKVYDNMDIVESVKHLISQGIEKNTAIKKVAKIKNIDKNEVYKKCTKMN